jgi:hypothetical protein
MEYWFSKGSYHFNFIVNPASGGTINPTLHYPLRAIGGRYEPEAGTHYSTIPAFQLISL